MLTPALFDQAVAQGLITVEQANALRELAGRPVNAQGSIMQPAGDQFAGGAEERFRIANGFNEVFVALGCLLLTFGLAMSFGWTGVSFGWGGGRDLSPRAAAPWALGFVLGLWGLSEYLTGRRRMLAPSIVLVVAMCLFAALATLPFFDGIDGRANSLPWQTLLLPASILAVATAHFARFRFPFSLLPIAVGVVILSAFLVAIASPEFAQRQWKSMMLVFGVGVFAAALCFDLSDPDRVTNRSDGAFWLHMVAAPLVVHPLMPSGLSNVGGVFAVFAALMLVAIVVDRRAILVASLSYLLAAVGYLVSQHGIAAGQASFLIPLIVGAGIVALGSGWQMMRRLVWSLLPGLGPLEPLWAH